MKIYLIFDPSGALVGSTQSPAKPTDTADDRHIPLPDGAALDSVWRLEADDSLTELDAAAEQLKVDSAVLQQAILRERDRRVNAAAPFPAADSSKTLWLHWGGTQDIETRTEISRWVEQNNPAAEDPLPFDPSAPASTTANQMYWAVAAYVDGFAAAKAERFAAGKFDLTAARWQALCKARDDWRLAHYAAAAVLVNRARAGDLTVPTASDWPQDLEAWLAANPSAHRV